MTECILVDRCQGFEWICCRLLHIKNGDSRFHQNADTPTDLWNCTVLNHLNSIRPLSNLGCEAVYSEYGSCDFPLSVHENIAILPQIRLWPPSAAFGSRYVQIVLPFDAPMICLLTVSLNKPKVIPVCLMCRNFSLYILSVKLRYGRFFFVFHKHRQKDVLLPLYFVYLFVVYLTTSSRSPFIQGVPKGKVNNFGGHSIGYSKQKSVYVHVSYSERFPR
jgi:hypothetical protein